MAQQRSFKRLLVLAMMMIVVDQYRVDGADLVTGGGLRVQFSERWFDQNCFGQLTEAMARRRCQELLDKRIQLADETVGLKADQRLKLQLAGKTDIHRFFVTYATLKRQFEFGDVTLTQWRDRTQNVYRKSDPYANQIVGGLNGESSLYEKMLNTVVETAAVAKIQKTYRDYAEKRYAQKIDQTIHQILRNAANRKLVAGPDAVEQKVQDQELQIDLSKALLPIGNTVHKKVVYLMLESTSPPEFYGNSRNYINIVAIKMLDIEEELASILTPRELARIRAIGQPLAKGTRFQDRALRRIQVEVRQ